MDSKRCITVIDTSDGSKIVKGYVSRLLARGGGRGSGRGRGRGREKGEGGHTPAPYEKVGDARRELFFWPLKCTKKGVVQAFFGANNGSIRNRKRTFRNKVFIQSRKFTSLTPEPLSGTVSTPKCYCRMFNILSPRFWPLSGTTSIPDLLIWESLPSTPPSTNYWYLQRRKNICGHEPHRPSQNRQHGWSGVKPLEEVRCGHHGHDAPLSWCFVMH